MEQVPPTQAAELAPCSGELTLFPHPTLTAHLCNVMHSARVEAGLPRSRMVVRNSTSCDLKHLMDVPLVSAAGTYGPRQLGLTFSEFQR
jgi:hypothetical protein